VVAECIGMATPSCPRRPPTPLTLLLATIALAAGLASCSRLEPPQHEPTGRLRLDMSGPLNFEGARFRLSEEMGPRLPRGYVSSVWNGDRPVTVLMGSWRFEGIHADPRIDFGIPRPFGGLVEFTTQVEQNEGRCSISIDRTDAVRTEGSFECRHMVGAVVRNGEYLVVPGANPGRLDAIGSFRLEA
jgi:hypothetical protein